MSSSHARKPLSVPFLIASFGLVFTIWNAWDASSVPCFSAGCTLYQTFTIKGLSLWWIGSLAFMVLAGLALAGQAAWGRLLAGAGVLLDCGLLCLMAFTLPCFSCMIAGLLLALSYLAFRHAATGVRQSGGVSRRSAAHPVSAPIRERGLHIPILFMVWLFCLVLLSGVALHSSLSPWAVRSSVDGESTAAIFFSPSCEACNRLVTEMPPAQARRASWYPVAESDQDLAIVLALKNRLENGDESLAAALESARQAPALSLASYFLPETLMLRFRLWRNEARVIEAGDGRLPFVAFRGLPVALIHSEPPPSRSVPSGPTGAYSLDEGENLDHTLPIDLGEAGSCGAPGAVPCP